MLLVQGLRFSVLEFRGVGQRYLGRGDFGIEGLEITELMV